MEHYRVVEQLMCQHCGKLYSFDAVVSNNHEVDSLNSIYQLIREKGEHPDIDSIRQHFFGLRAEGHGIPDATHHLKLKHNLYPPAPPAQNIVTEEAIS